MALEISLREICASLTSVRSTERKKSAEALKDMLSRTAVPSLLNENTFKKSGYTWSHVFSDINDYILKETEKYETNKNFSMVVGIANSLLNLCVSGSNKGGAYIKCDIILEACLNILNDNRLRRAVGDAYFCLLYKHVICNEYFKGYISPSMWENLLDVGVTTCLKNSSDLDNLTKFKFLLLVIKSIGDCTQCLVCLRDSLSELIKCFQNVMNDKKVQELTMKIVLLIIEVLSSECRLFICDFSEKVLPLIYKFYDTNMDVKKKSLLFKVLQAAVIIHHPMGRLKTEEASLAINWDIWNKQLQSILEIVCLETAYIQKQIKQNNNSQTNVENFSYLATIAYYQIFNENNGQDIEGEENSAKKQRVSFNNKKTFDDLIDEFEQNPEPWVGIIFEYVKQFNQTLQPSHYFRLLEISESLVASTGKNFSWNDFGKMISLVIEYFENNKKLAENRSDIFIGLWNMCVRNSAIYNAAHTSIHLIMVSLLRLDVIKYIHVQPLLIFYFEKGMPVNNHSLKTLTLIYFKFFTNCCHLEQRLKCLNWLSHVKTIDIDVETLGEFFFQLISDDNILSVSDTQKDMRDDNIYNFLFNNIQKTILFNNFELDLNQHEKASKTETKKLVYKTIEKNRHMYEQVMNHFQTKLCEISSNMSDKDAPIEMTKYLHTILLFFKTLLEYNLLTMEEILNSQLYFNLVDGLKNIFSVMTQLLRSNEQPRDKIAVLKSAQSVLEADYNGFLNGVVRSCIAESCFHAINDILKSEVDLNEEENNYEDEIELSFAGVRHHCVYFVSAFCTQPHDYTDELIKCILESDIYKLDSQWDVECALKCLTIIMNSDRNNKYLAPMFTLMQNMCRVLFRNSKASLGLLRLLMNIIEKVWVQNDNVIRQNCIIMVKSYLQRCSKLYYPPHVAVLVYECAAKVVRLNDKNDMDLNELFKDAIIEQIKGDVHSIRIYCCYLMRHMHIEYADVKHVSSTLMDIFVINVLNDEEIILTDETHNRTLTVLHCVCAMSQAKPYLIHDVILELLYIQRKKSLSAQLLRKVLNIVLKKVMNTNFEDYVNKNVKRILYGWCHKNEALEDLPFNILGFKSIDTFIEKHLKWIVASDVLWRKHGHVETSDTTKYIVAKSGTSLDDIIEMSFCSIVSLCLPYIVIEKYKLEDQKDKEFRLSLENSNRTFQSTRKILKNEKWSNLFVENMGELILLAATHLCDPNNAQFEFNVTLFSKRHAFNYSKTVFKAVLTYFGELIDGDIMQYLCENQPLVILNILFKLWAYFLKENVLEFKILYLHAYLSFIEMIPLGYQSDAVLYSFAGYSLINATVATQTSDELNALICSLKVLMEKILNYPSDALKSLKKSLVSKVLSILSIKKEEGLKFSDNLESYLLNYNDASNGDVVDYVDLLKKCVTGSQRCSTKLQFTEILQKFVLNLSFPSVEVLVNLEQFLKLNNEFVNDLKRDLNNKGFSEDCSTSPLHCTINALNNILKSSNDHKVIIKACDCLGDICTYDIKSLVTVPPADTVKAVSLPPKQYFAFIVLSTLSDELFDEDPAVNTKVAKAVNRLLKFRDGLLALDLDGINKDILQPLSPSNSEIFSIYKLDDSKFDSYNCLDLWVPKQNEDHSMWVVRITTAMLDLIASNNNCIAALSAVCVVKPSVSAKLMPSFIGLLLDCKSDKLIQVLSEQINIFFAYIWDMTFDDKLESTDDGTSKLACKLDNTHKKIIQYIINVINFVRLQGEHYAGQGGHAERLNYLRVDYLRVSWAAALAGREPVALYYGELYACARAAAPPASPALTAALPGGRHLHTIFRGCFMSIGEPDAVEGCGAAHLAGEEATRRHLAAARRYGDALLLLDIALSGAPRDRALQRAAAAALHCRGMHHLALRYAAACADNDDLDAVKYDCLAYLGDWSAFVDTRNLEEKSKTSSDLSSIIKMYRYAGLKDCLNIEPTEQFMTRLNRPLNAAKLTISRLCRNLNMENSQCVYKVMAYLHLFRDIEQYFAVRCGKETIIKLIHDWQIERLPPYKDFKHLESLISQRGLILQHAAENNPMYSATINSLHLKYAELALANERIQMAQRTVATIKKFQPSKEVTLLESKVSWEKGHKEIALSLLQDNITDESDNAILTAMSLRQYGIWMAECKRENARDIINKYLEKSLNILKDCDDVDTRLKVYYDIATFADGEYKQVVSYMNSSIFENKVKCLESLKGTAASLKSSQQTLTRDEKKALIANNAFKELDEADIAHTRAEKDSFLNLAMKYYLLSLKQSDENNLSVFRVISLWFENNGIELDNEETGRLGELLQAIPSWKFITVLPQIAPRLSTENTPFAEHLRQLIKRCAIEHPHHTLPILFNLKNSDKDELVRSRRAGTGTGIGMSTGTGTEPRVTAARALLAALPQRRPLGTALAQLDRLCDAIIDFAYFVPATKQIGKPLPIPNQEEISKLRNLDSIPVPTDTIAIKRDCDYSSLSSFSSFDNNYQLVGGINAPKKISCRSSDGKKRILLIKGEDDLRQDAVMQQVFNIVNTLLEKNPVTYHNKLLIRTYKVVPLSRRSGALEWCEGTMPLGAYLTHAHTKYRPQDITPSQARSKLIKCHENRRSNKHKLEVFNEILKVFKPAFHYFFTEHYLDPVTWYERRLAYTRSVATSSMVGYIMGIGDRHVQNILIDKTTAEVIHIDFGIAFDQGKTLPTPETVPFRLTQDIVAGFGCSGVEGIFRRCCEKTLQLLRDNQETLLTILEVLLCDPLYLWIVPNAAKNTNVRRAGASAGACAGAGGGLAERALLAVRDKLSGTERGAAAVSVPGQVAALLRRAGDPAHLCRLFHGWQPYL